MVERKGDWNSGTISQKGIFIGTKKQAEELEKITGYTFIKLWEIVMANEIDFYRQLRLIEKKKGSATKEDWNRAYDLMLDNALKNVGVNLNLTKIVKEKLNK